MHNRLYGAGGSRHIYGLPLYARDQRSLQLGLPNIMVDSAERVKHNTRAYSYTHQITAPTALGQIVEDPIATMFLLTTITTPDYVDLTGDGPSNDDLGGWTVFRYERTAGGDDKTADGDVWCPWRAPFDGLTFNAGELSDPMDDLGGFSSGARESYYLTRIETKTHVAVFVRNDNVYDRRKDGLTPNPMSQFQNRMVAAGDTLGVPYLSVGHLNRMLDRIELYTRDESGDADSLLSRTYFEYDYSLREGMINSEPTSWHPDSTRRFGMLTLKKVWTEPLGVREYKTAPYIFGYEYRKSGDYSGSVRARYGEIVGYADSLSSTQENPEYSRFDLDPWGYHRPSMIGQFDNRASWIDQSDSSLWDPAAWQLKTVRLPTGGEMHIQYEEDDYAFVQDRPVLAMARLLEDVEGAFGKNSDDQTDYSRCYVDLASIGIDPTDKSQVIRAYESIERLIESDRKLYFRFFYALKGSNANWSDPVWNSEYVSGYADAESVILDSVGVHPNTTFAIMISLEGYDEDGLHDYGVPKLICHDYVKKRKRGKFGPDEGVPWSPDFDGAGSVLHAKHYRFDENKYCNDIDYSKSYLRLPLPSAKRGGGLRVKRILFYDPGVEGDSMLYGTEYRYEVYDQERKEVISSGVASNEPPALREENPLVRFLNRNETEEIRGKVISGRDLPRYEGPIGETLLPGASIGYSRVATHPIHQGASASGFAVKDFFTYRDYPFDTQYPGLGRTIDYTDVNGDDYETSPFFSNFIFFRHQEHLVHRTQGYRFVLTDIHGKPKNLFTNGGTYSPFEDDWFTSSSIEYDYFLPGDSVPLLYFPGDSIRYGWPGKSMDVVTASRKNGSYLSDQKNEGDAGWIYISALPYAMVQNSELLTHVTTKVVQYPTMLRGVKTYADGDYEYRENVAFDPSTGGVAMTRTWDAFDGLVLDQSPLGHEGGYTSYSFAAADELPVFGTAARNERALIASSSTFEIVKDSTALYGPHLLFPGGSEMRWLMKLTPGDLIELTLIDSVGAGRYHVESIEGRRVKLQESFLYNDPEDTAFANIGVVDVQVIRSGRLNLPGASFGGVATYGTTDQDLASGTNFGWSGIDATARLTFVDQLNTALGLGTDTLSSSNVSSTLKFFRASDSACDDLGGLSMSLVLSTSGDSIFVSSPTYVDIIVSMGGGGRFELDNSGQIVYRAFSKVQDIDQLRTDPGTRQRLVNLRLCGDSLQVYRTVDNVIAASASIINDTIEWSSGAHDGVGWVHGESNAFERGERGRYSTRTGYSYRTSVTGSANPTTGARVYENAGVFDNFSLFNWSDPSLSDMSHWRGLDSVTRVSRDNVPFETVDQLGRSSTARFRSYRGDLNVLEQTGWNAEEGTIVFESFETKTTLDYDGAVTDTMGHSGDRSLHVGSSNTSLFSIDLVINVHLMERGAIARFWLYNGVAEDVRFVIGSTSSEIQPDSIARVGKWLLLEQEILADSLQAHYSSGDTLLLTVKNIGPGPFWIDDVKAQPSDGVSTASVYDPATLAMVATFDNDNFGAYPVYDGEGRAVRTVVETARGRRTVADAHANVSGVIRDWDGQGSPWGAQTFSPPTMSSSIGIGGGDESKGVDFEAVDLHIELDHQSLKIFGVSPSDLKKAVADRVGDIDKLDPSQQRLLSDYEKLHARKALLETELEAASTKEEKSAIQTQMDIVNDRQKKILSSLGFE